MDIQYYRKGETEHPKFRVLRRLWQSRILRWSLVIGIPFLLFVTFSNKGIIQRMKLESEKKLWEQKVSEAEQEQKRLQQLSKSLDAENANAGAIEKIAREKYGMVKEGETVYRVKTK